uniref:Secreted protein n=1 Tax=Vespula pensylvanica TaxID=30213 RepID=A0A834KLK7_VESPE|nr:hypothetical protein H0235_013732 [Vespula pensylvanica]
MTTSHVILLVLYLLRQAERSQASKFTSRVGRIRVVAALADGRTPSQTRSLSMPLCPERERRTYSFLTGKQRRRLTGHL